MTEEKEKAIQKEQGTKPLPGPGNNELSDDDLEKLSGGTAAEECLTHQSR